MHANMMQLIVRELIDHVSFPRLLAERRASDAA
jgi:hypothetical protein